MGIPGVLQCTAVCTYIEEHSKITLMSEPGHGNALYDTPRYSIRSSPIYPNFQMTTFKAKNVFLVFGIWSYYEYIDI